MKGDWNILRGPMFKDSDPQDHMWPIETFLVLQNVYYSGNKHETADKEGNVF